jgi:two-component system response regulator YesN
MFKVVIADDEYLICQLIKNLIIWEELDLDLVGKAGNGFEAYELLVEHKPEILITDIKMPRLDGLELVKKARDENINCRFVIISGHRHFEYARNALKYNVEDYLLKPINKDDLNATLKKVCRSLAAEKQDIEKRNEIYGQLENSRNSLRRHFINYTASDMKKVEGSSLSTISKEFDLEFTKGLFQAFIIKIDINGGKPDNTDFNSLLSKISGLCDKRLTSSCYEFISSPVRNGVLVLLNYDTNDSGTVKKEIKSLFEEIRLVTDMFSDLSSTMGAGTVEDNIDQLPESIAAAMNAVKCRILLGRNRIIDGAALNYRTNGPGDLIGPDKEKQLRKAFEVLDNDAYREWLEGIMACFIGDISPAVMYDIGERVSEMFLNTIKSLKLELNEDKPLGEEIVTMLDSSGNMDDVFRSIFNPVSRRITELSNQKEMMDSKPVRDAKIYIADHYMEQIKLEDVARAVYLNPIYLSTIFKMHSGINYTDYLTNYRIDAAKELLKSTGISIAEIAAKVGYMEARYFSKIFTKTVGIKPKDYRKLYG